MYVEKKYRVRISLHGYLFNKFHMLVVEFFHVVGLYLAADLCYKYLKTTSGFYTLTSLNNGCPGLATLYCTPNTFYCLKYTILYVPLFLVITLLSSLSYFLRIIGIQREMLENLNGCAFRAMDFFQLAAAGPDF